MLEHILRELPLTFSYTTIIYQRQLKKKNALIFIPFPAASKVHFFLLCIVPSCENIITAN